MSDPTIERTSVYLRQCLERSVGEGHTFLGRLPKDTRSTWESLAPTLLDQFEGVAHVLENAHVSGPPENMALLLDDLLCRSFLGNISELVDRVMKFDRIVTIENPSDSVHLYFRQAMRCYALGLPLAAVALARACLEHSLRERVPHAAAILELENLITAAARFKALDPAQLQLATDVRKMGNNVMHRAGCSDEQAFDVILKVRALVEALYKPAD